MISREDVIVILKICGFFSVVFYMLAFILKPNLVPICKYEDVLCNGLCYDIIPNLVPCIGNFYTAACLKYACINSTYIPENPQYVYTDNTAFIIFLVIGSMMSLLLIISAIRFCWKK